MNKEEIIADIKACLAPIFDRRLLGGQSLTDDFIAKWARVQMIGLFDDTIEDVLQDAIVQELIEWGKVYGVPVHVDAPHCIKSDALNDVERIHAEDISEWAAWNRYEVFLEHERHMPLSVVKSISSSTKEIIELLPAPQKNDAFDCRGLVVGDVQSGKTANYAGLLARAADAGYRVIIVAAGGTNDLRSQTQQRLERDFAAMVTVGRSNVVTVEKYGKVPYHVVPYTSVADDFSGSVDRAALGNPENLVFLVIKKNGAVLRRVIQSFEGMRNQNPRAFRDSALLFVDDEADYASVNASGEVENPTAINRLIREVLDMFQKSSYVGYTATPYANVFINPTKPDTEADTEDLFPRDFIYCLGTPSNYEGPAKLFLSEVGSENAVQSISPEDEFKKAINKRGNRPSMPASMEYALGTYILAHAIIRLRNLKMQFSGMLIHVDRKTTPHERIRELVESKLQEYKDELQCNAIGSIDDESVPHLAKLQQVWQEQYEGKLDEETPITWENVRAKICDEEFLDELKVFKINSETESLDYNRTDNVAAICIGGDKLARGLTIEGLVTTYFLRCSHQYDSLMQMGRWFGYRPGYRDICRVFMPDELRLYFSEIATATEELKGEIREMKNRKMTPLEFGLRVRNDVSGLLITSRNKMRAAEQFEEHVRTAGGFFFTNVIPSDNESREKNNADWDSFLLSLSNLTGVACEQTKNAFVWKDVPAEVVIPFLKHMAQSGLDIFKTSDFCLDARQVVIEALKSEAFIDVSLVKLIREDSGVKIPFFVQGELRSVCIGKRNPSSDHAHYIFEKNNATAAVDERGDLKDEEILHWLREVKGVDDQHYEMGRKDYRSCRAYYKRHNKPLLIMASYMLPETPLKCDSGVGMRSCKEIDPNVFTKRISACGLSFPNSDAAGNGASRTIKYVYNQTAIKALKERLKTEED